MGVDNVRCIGMECLDGLGKLDELDERCDWSLGI